MKSLHNKKNMTRTMAAVWTIACLLMGSTTVYAAGAGVIEGYEALYQATVVEVEEQAIEDQYIEYREEPDDRRSSTVPFEWTVGANASKRTPSFEMPSGGYITVSVSVEPTDLKVNVGIVEPDGGRRYITGSDTIHYKFSLDQSGNYMVFVENPNSAKVSVAGYYKK